MTRDTLILLLVIAALSLILTVAVLFIVDAMTLTPPPDAETVLKATGAIQ